MLHGMLRSSGKMASAFVLVKEVRGQALQTGLDGELGRALAALWRVKRLEGEKAHLVESLVDEVKRLGQRVALVDAEGQLRGDEVDEQGPSAKAVDGQ